MCAYSKIGVSENGTTPAIVSNMTTTQTQTENLEILSNMAASAIARIVDPMTGKTDRKQLRLARDATAGMVQILKNREVDRAADWWTIVEAHAERIA